MQPQTAHLKCATIYEPELLSYFFMQGKALQDWHPQRMKKAGLGTEVEGMMKAVLELSWLCRVVPPGK